MRDAEERRKWFGFLVGAGALTVFCYLMEHIGKVASATDITVPRAIAGASMVVLLVVLVSKAEQLLTPLVVIERLDLERARRAKDDSADDRIVTLVTKILAVVRPQPPKP